MLRKILTIAVVVLALGVVAGIVYSAAGMTISFQVTSATQDSKIQTKHILRANQQLCAQFSLPKTCTSAQLVAAGCTAVPLSFGNVLPAYQNCTTFTQDAGGETALAVDLFSRGVIALANVQLQDDPGVACATFKAMDTPTQTSTCTLLGLNFPCAPFGGC